MGHRERVKIVEVCKVEPSETITTTTPKHLPLTFFDLLFLRFPSIKRVYFFNTWSSDVIPRLKQSLSLALCHFLPLAGNLIWPKSSTVPFVRYVEGDGVSFSMAEPGLDLDFDVLSCMDVASETEAYLALLPNFGVSSEKAALMAVQVTIFPGNGFSIGVTLRHAVLDGKSVHMFVKSWAHICRSLDSEGFSSSLPSELTPSYDRTTVQDLGGFGEIYARNWMSFDGPRNRSLNPMEQNHLPDSVRRTFTLTRRDIEKIRLTIASQTTAVDRTSTFSIVCAYVWVCLVKAEVGVESGNFNAMLTIPCDCRSRLDPPLPPNYFGNCITGTMAVAKGRDLAADWREGLGSALKPVVEVIKSFGCNGVLNEAEDWVLQWASFVPSNPGDKFYSVAGSPRFETYAADFGWGRPQKTDVVSNGAIVMQDARDGDGIEFGLALKKLHMESFATHFRHGLES